MIDRFLFVLVLSSFLLLEFFLLFVFTDKYLLICVLTYSHRISPQFLCYPGQGTKRYHPIGEHPGSRGSGQEQTELLWTVCQQQWCHQGLQDRLGGQGRRGKALRLPDVCLNCGGEGRLDQVYQVSKIIHVCCSLFYCLYQYQEALRLSELLIYLNGITMFISYLSKL